MLTYSLCKTTTRSIHHFRVSPIIPSPLDPRTQKMPETTANALDTSRATQRTRALAGAPRQREAGNITSLCQSEVLKCLGLGAIEARFSRRLLLAAHRIKDEVSYGFRYAAWYIRVRYRNAIYRYKYAAWYVRGRYKYTAWQLRRAAVWAWYYLLYVVYLCRYALWVLVRELQPPGS